MSMQRKENIANAFLALTKKKNIDKITVKDLVEYCGISRQSFYYHFPDITGVIEWLMLRQEEEISARIYASNSFEDAIRILAESVLENQGLIIKLRNSQKRDFFERLILNTMQERFRQAIRESSSDASGNMTAAETETLIRFFSFGLTGLIISFCHSRDANADQLTKQVLSVFRNLSVNPNAFL